MAAVWLRHLEAGAALIRFGLPPICIIRIIRATLSRRTIDLSPPSLLMERREPPA